MKRGSSLAVLLFGVLGAFLFQGCYTQLAVAHPVYVEHQAPHNSPREAAIQTEQTQDTLQDAGAVPDTVIYEHYWMDHPYDPYYYDSRFYLDLHFAWGDPYWYPWYYSGYGPWSPSYWNYGWYWGDPFWCYPYYYDYGYLPGYYSWYSGYGYPYWDGYYYPYDYVDPLPKKKRGWERRGGELADRTVTRPSSGSSGGEEAIPVAAPGLMAKGGSGSQKGERSVQRGSQRPSPGVSRGSPASGRKAGRSDVRRVKGRSQYVKGKTIVRIRTAKRVYDLIRFVRHGSDDRKGTSRSGSVKSKRGSSSSKSHSGSSGSVSRSVSRSSSSSSSGSRGSSRSSGGKSRGR